MTAAIPPDMGARVISMVYLRFRPERLIISPHSFPLSLTRRAWTWPLVAIGSVLIRAHRRLAKILRVDPCAPHERKEYMSAEYAQTHEVCWDDDDDRPFVLVPTKLNRRERLLAPLDRASRRLSQVRLRWQQAQLSTLTVCDITISGRSQFVDGQNPLPADMFATSQIDDFVNLGDCAVGQKIGIEVHNGNRRKCQLQMSFVGQILS